MTARKRSSRWSSIVPALVITDFALPGIDGLELTRRIRVNQSTQHVPVICLSGYSGDALEPRAREVGCDRMLEKPCLPISSRRSRVRWRRAGVPHSRAPQPDHGASGASRRTQGHKGHDAHTIGFVSVVALLTAHREGSEVREGPACCHRELRELRLASRCRRPQAEATALERVACDGRAQAPLIAARRSLVTVPPAQHEEHNGHEEHDANTVGFVFVVAFVPSWSAAGAVIRLGRAGCESEQRHELTAIGRRDQAEATAR